MLRKCRDCKTVKNDRYFYPEGKSLCMDCANARWEEMQEFGRKNPYLKTDLGVTQKDSQWSYKMARYKRLQLANYQCEGCAEKQELSLHHKTYIRIGRELLDDVNILCRKCHKQADRERREDEVSHPEDHHEWSFHVSKRLRKEYIDQVTCHLSRERGSVC